MATANIKIGSASWADKSLLTSGMYYPSWCKTAEDRLRFYSSEFPMVEVDSSYYALPSSRNSSLWVERTPDDFVFNIKAFRLFTTHPTPPVALPKDLRETMPPELAAKRNVYYADVPAAMRDRMWEMYRDGIMPLQSAGKLRVVVLQFPAWFMPRKSSFEHIDECRERLSGFKTAVEFRNKYWLSDENRESTLSYLRRNGMSYICVDEPQGMKSSVPPIADVTADIGIVRFHGRNTEMWEAKGLTASPERFDYYYSRPELEEWAPKIESMRKDAAEVHLVMNTNAQDQAIKNGRLLAEIIGEGLKPAPTLF
ncbi:MAG: DUF72 domain-containing protein [SAR202 cluster bacterium]|nr:DUF72 domain-containing protein [SAR202 cluster bacterium]